MPDPQHQLEKLHDVVEGSVDPLGLFTPIAHAELAWLMHPHELAQKLGRLSTDLMALQVHAWRRALGLSSEDPVQPHADDSRFADPEWKDSATSDIVKEWYLLLTRHVQDALHETPGLTGKERRRAAYWWREWLNAAAPTNFFWTNPVAIRKFFETDGDSVARGMRIFLEDLKAGTVRMTSPDDFALGENLATTPGAVVYRNPLVEIIHYAPTTRQVYETPIVIVMPWINKFYVLDLTPKKSMVRYLLDQGFSVFITSWKNPTADMRDTTFDDYLLQGVDKLVEVARGVTGADKVHAVGYCLGGIALSCYMAWANRKCGKLEDVPVAHWTVFTTMVDFHNPGDIEVFIDENSVRWLSMTAKQSGYRDGNEIAAGFRLLRSNSLIWHYVVHGYLYGESPQPYDVLYWNMDPTRVPYKTHDWLMRELYLKDKLIRKDAVELGGQPIDLEAIRQPLYSVAAVDDHIVPWRQAFRINNFVTAPKRFVLSTSGHILGIVNPPVDPPKREYWAADAHRADRADSWRERAEKRAGSWWGEWMAWLKPQCGRLVDAPPVATEAYPKLADAPGDYVLEK